MVSLSSLMVASQSNHPYETVKARPMQYGDACLRPEDAMHRAGTTVILLLVACLARAAEPPPDPSRGESYDGVAHHPSATDDALAVPRILLSPLRLLMRGLAVPVHHLLDWDEVHHVHEMAFAAFSSRDGLIGVRPAFQYSISFAPVVGLRFFDQKLLGPTTDFGVTAMTGGIHIVYAEVAARPTPADRALEATVRVAYNRRNDQVFTGIGYATETNALNQPSRYAIDAVDGGGRLTWLAARGVTANLDTMVGVRRFGNGTIVGGEQPIASVYCIRSLSGLCVPGTVDPLRVPGFNQGTQFFRAAANFLFDSRDNMYRPSSGALVELGADWSHGLGWDDSDYVRLHAGAVGGARPVAAQPRRWWCASRPTICSRSASRRCRSPSSSCSAAPTRFAASGPAASATSRRCSSASSIAGRCGCGWTPRCSPNTAACSDRPSRASTSSACGPTWARACACARRTRSSRARRWPTAGATAGSSSFR